MVYALIGITVVLKALYPFIGWLRGDWRDRIANTLFGEAKVDTMDLRVSMEEVNKMINYNRRYALALIGPIMILITGILLHWVYGISLHR